MGRVGGFAAWAKPVDAVAAYHAVDLQTGLTERQVESQRAKYGFNELEKQPGKPLWKLVLEQFDDMLVKVRAFHDIHVSVVDSLKGLRIEVISRACIISFG